MQGPRNCKIVTSDIKFCFQTPDRTRWRDKSNNCRIDRIIILSISGSRKKIAEWLPTYVFDLQHLKALTAKYNEAQFLSLPR
jgi:hypothetical protein